MQLGTFFFPSLKASGEEETKKKLENWNLTCLQLGLGCAAVGGVLVFIAKSE